jgi:transposase
LHGTALFALRRPRRPQADGRRLRPDRLRRKVVKDVESFGTTTEELLLLSDWLTERGCTHVAMEATGVYWKPVWHVLSDGGFALILANAAHVKNVPGRKTDITDAAWLAELLAHGLIRASFVPDAATEAMRTLLRTRKQLVREKASHTQRIQKTLQDANIPCHQVPARPSHVRRARASSARRRPRDGGRNIGDLALFEEPMADEIARPLLLGLGEQPDRRADVDGVMLGLRDLSLIRRDPSEDLGAPVSQRQNY